MNFNYNSSLVDWCEENYVWSPYIAEWWNTLSSLTLLFEGLFFLIYGTYFTNNISERNLLQVFGGWFIIIGIGSIIFHGTLSVFGQFLDECSITHLLWYSFSIIYDWKAWWLWIINIIAMFLFFIYPSINAFGLVIQGCILTRLIFHKSKTDSSSLRFAGFLIAIGIISWILDQFCFQHYVSLHAIWHICISSGTTVAILWFKKHKREIVNHIHICKDIV